MYHNIICISLLPTFSREAQLFVEKFEGALGKGKGKKFYAYKVMMTKVNLLFHQLHVMQMGNLLQITAISTHLPKQSFLYCFAF